MGEDTRHKTNENRSNVSGVTTLQFFLFSLPTLPPTPRTMFPENTALSALMDAAAVALPLPADREMPQEQHPNLSSPAVSDDDRRSVSSEDFSQDCVPAVCNSCEVSWTIRGRGADRGLGGTTRKKNHSLPVILMNLLMDERNHEIMFFSPDGSSFKILSPHRFSAEMMSHSFYCVNFPTFLKKMEMWGFETVQSGGDGNNALRLDFVFRHPLFRRGDWKSCRRIRRIASSGSTMTSVARSITKTGTPSTTKMRTSLTSDTRESASVGPMQEFNGRTTSSLMRSTSPQVSSDDELCTLMAVDNYLRLRGKRKHGHSVVANVSHDELSDMTNVVVRSAIDALMRDEDHARKLLSNEGSTQRYSADLLVHSRLLKSDELRSFMKAQPPRHRVGSSHSSAETDVVLQMERERILLASMGRTPFPSM